MAQGQAQIGNTGSPRLVTMTAGGNNAGFYGIATDCIYQQIDKDYGPDYPDPESACAKSIQRSHDYIHRDYSEGGGGLAYDLNVTLADLMDTDAARSHIGFFLYLTGYAKFFDVSGTWCDNQSFGAKLRKPKLTLELRKAINGLTQDLNDLYRQTIKDFPAHGMRFIDIDPGFDKNRFCMEPSLLQRPWWFSAQYYWTYVWLWNLSVPASDNTLVDANNIPKAPPDEDNAYQGLVTTADIGPQGGGNEEGTPGWQQRPFHPKAPGYTAIKDAIIAQMKTDSIPESDAECTTPTEKGSPSVDDAKKMNDGLNAHGDDDCCAGDASKNESNCKGLDPTNVGGKSVILCGDGTGQCIKCAQAANYLAGLITTCTQNGVVSAKQDINGMPGLSIQI